MIVCKHCGTEIEDGLEYCPNCGQSTEEIISDFFEPDEGLEEEAYNIFDAPEEFDMDSLLSREFQQGAAMPVQSEPEETDDLAELFGLFGEEPEAEVEEFFVEEEKAAWPAAEEIETAEEIEVAEEADFFALDDLFQDLEEEPVELKQEEQPPVDEELVELLTAGTEEQPEKETKKRKEKNLKKEKQSFFETVFGNVPVDPSKVKPEPTPEQIAAKKQKAAEEKKAKAEEKKLAAEEKKQISQQKKQEKARQKALAKEEKKAKKLQEAKQILEEIKETRINRLGATIVFLFFIVCAIVLISGSGIFGYAISVHSAEKNFNMAYNNNVKYYTDAYNDIYGLDIKLEDQVLSDKIMTVMFVNKQLNSYNSYMVMGDYQAALHSLLMGLYRYGAYYETAIPLGVERDMDYVRTQILKELEATFDISEDEAELLRSMLVDAGVGGMNMPINENAAREYNLELYEIVKESGLDDDSNN